MQISKQTKKSGAIHRASANQRLIAAIIFVCIALVFVFLALAAWGKIDIERWAQPCGFKQRYGLPCPTCGFTTAALAFVQGKILQSFYIQPAGGLLCILLVFAAVLAFLTAVFGIYFDFIRRLFTNVKLKYILLAVVIIIVAAWMVTLARAMALKGP
ncbi:MAG: DUF2752 domain-containing protein [Sedimentisphaerales bacterium]|nr:DUF2752 domain-containing protein [Sedimentisphaerales bacterium]